jgi:hypothetical protein
MTSHTRDLDRFIRAVHRRWVIVRAAEHVGMCVLGGCVLALVFLPILLWRGEPALPTVGMITLLAATAGLIAGIVRRPDRMSAATEADRQLGLAELLSSALTMRDRASTDAWATVLLATAEARCRTLSPNDVILNRLGARAWGGIGLAAALVLTLGLMSANPRTTVAVTPPGADAASMRDVAQSNANETAGHSRGAQPRHDLDRRGRSIDESRTDMAPGESANGRSAAQRSTAASESAGGGGLATSHAPAASASPHAPTDTASHAAQQGDPVAGGRAAGSASIPPSDDAHAGSSLTPAVGESPAPPWQSASWPAQRDEALSAVRDGRVPDAYQDLVRAYFADESASPKR